MVGRVIIFSFNLNISPVCYCYIIGLNAYDFVIKKGAVICAGPCIIYNFLSDVPVPTRHLHSHSTSASLPWLSRTIHSAAVHQNLGVILDVSSSSPASINIDKSYKYDLQ